MGVSTGHLGARSRGAAALVTMGCGAALLAGQAAGVVTTREHGIEFATIGDPGNRPVNEQEGPDFYSPLAWTQPNLVGSVGYEYRLSRTEITTAQWHEFVQAYAPYYTGSPNTSSFTSQFIYPDGTLPGGVQKYSIAPGTEQLPVDVGWRHAARFCNWLHNGKALTPEAFESGAYDTSTFTQNAQGWLNDQGRHSEGARFWIPTLNEWIKGMHWDPNKDGQGEGGYWQYPTTSDEEPVSGLPGTFGAQTATALAPPPFWQAVAMYPDVMSPWGLLDGSGGENEWLEESPSPERLARRVDGGSAFSNIPSWHSEDILDRTSIGLVTVGGVGLRIASIPAPGAWSLLLAGVVGFRNRRRE